MAAVSCRFNRQSHAYTWQVSGVTYNTHPFGSCGWYRYRPKPNSLRIEIPWQAYRFPNSVRGVQRIFTYAKLISGYFNTDAIKLTCVSGPLLTDHAAYDITPCFTSDSISWMKSTYVRLCGNGDICI